MACSAGRVERTNDAYNLIYLSLVYTQAVEPASQALVENYIFTREAFKTYLNRLAPSGRLTIVSHNALEGSRAMVGRSADISRTVAGKLTIVRAVTKA